jgi:hypothetical protein
VTGPASCNGPRRALRAATGGRGRRMEQPNSGETIEAPLKANTLRIHTDGRPGPADQSDLPAALASLAPLPSRWVVQHSLQSMLAGWKRRGGLVYAPATTPWQRRCSLPAGRHLPWLLWSALRALNMDDPRYARLIMVSGDGSGLARVPAPLYRGSRSSGTTSGGPTEPATARLCQRRTRPGDILVRIGGATPGAVTPGPIVEESAEALGWPVHPLRHGRQVDSAEEEAIDASDRLWAASLASWADDDDACLGMADPAWGPERTIPEGEDAWAPSVVAVLADEEARHSARWLGVRRDLGLVAVLGPLSDRQASSVTNGQAEGFIGDDGGLTQAGWWRLAYSAEQGVGPVELRRAAQLTAIPHHHRRHLTITQRLCLEFMEAGCVPLGVEYSVTAEVIADIMPQPWRADALLIDRDGALVWLEVMRRHPSRLGERSAAKYASLEATYLPTLAEVMQRPVRLHIWLLGHERSVTFTPSGEPA